MPCAVALVLCLVASIAAAQADSPPAASLERCGDASASVTRLHGQVVDAHGTPLEGAVVVSSAGGMALTDASGRYELALTLPVAAESVHVTAVHQSRSGTSNAARLISPLARGESMEAGILVLAGSSGVQPGWLPAFGAKPGLSDELHALAVFDDGNGPALYAGGTFTTAGGQPASRIARWNGKTWSGLGGGVSDGFGEQVAVRALAVFDDGSGPALYVGGRFHKAGGTKVAQIARWDGSSWSSPGELPDGRVTCLLVHTPEGGDPVLVAGGSFAAIARCYRLQQITGWQGLGNLGSGSVDALAVFDDGSGPLLYAGGTFQQAGGQPSPGLAFWAGATWAPVGGGVSGGSKRVSALSTFDDGSGPALYLGGSFTAAGGVDASGLARWDGETFTAADGELFQSVDALAVCDVGDGPALHAAGLVTLGDSTSAVGVARRDGDTYVLLATPNDTVSALATFDGGGGPRLHVGGAFTAGFGSLGDRVAAWDGKSWSALGTGPDNTPRAVATFDDGAGPALYVGGQFTAIGAQLAIGIARWDGMHWAALGEGLNGDVHALCVFDDGSGPALYVGGSFSTAGGEQARRVARWDSSGWLPLGSGMNGDVLCFTVFDDGGGPALYAGGDFTTADGVIVNRVARWDGSSWNALGTGVVKQGIATTASVRALAVFDAGGGPALYAGGDFTKAGVAASGIARWDGTSWSAVGGGVSGSPPPLTQAKPVSALAVFDDGSGEALYVGGEFVFAGGTSARRIARWNGSTWSGLGSGADDAVNTLHTFDDGNGPALYAGGTFTVAGGLAANHVAKWDGRAWSALGSGVPGAVHVLGDSGGFGDLSLLVGGSFSGSTLGDSHLARWGSSPWLDLGGGTAGTAGTPQLALHGSLEPASVLALDLVAAPASTLAFLLFAPSSTPAPFLGGTLHAFPFTAITPALTDDDGVLHAAVEFPGAPAGLQFWAQAVLQDAFSIHGFSLSNGVKGTVP